MKSLASEAGIRIPDLLSPSTVLALRATVEGCCANGRHQFWCQRRTWSGASASVPCSTGCSRPRRAETVGVLVLHGEPGVGKTALLEYAIEAGEGYRVARTSGVEGEMELPFAALQQLCSSVPRAGGEPPATAARRARHRLRSEGRTASEPVPRWTGGPGAVVGGCRGRPAPDRRRRRSVARCRVGARAHVRRAPPVGGEDRARVRDTRAGRARSRACRELRVEPLGHRDAQVAAASPSCRPRWMTACSTGSSMRRAGIHSRCSSCHAGCRRRSSRAASGCPRTCPCPRASRRASRVGWRRFRTNRDASCSWRRPTRSAIRR